MMGSVALTAFIIIFGCGPLAIAYVPKKGLGLDVVKATTATGKTGPSPTGYYSALVQVDIRCEHDQVNGLVCAAQYPDKCREQWNFPNPCTQYNIDQNITKFVHPFDKTKFLMCGQLGKLYVVQCPQHEAFHEGCGECVGEVAGLSASCEVPMSLSSPILGNPCTKAAILANKLFFPFPRNMSMFIHCDIWGKPWERICTPGEVWSEWDVTCVLPHLLDPCNRPTTNLNYLYKHPCNPRMYLQCDAEGRAHEVICPQNTAYDESSQQCISYQRFSQSTDFLPFCEHYIFGFRTIHGNSGTPLPNDTNAMPAIQSIGQVVSSSVGVNNLDAAGQVASVGSNVGLDSNIVWQDVRTQTDLNTVNQPNAGTSGSFADIKAAATNLAAAAGAQTNAGQTANWQNTQAQSGLPADTATADVSMMQSGGSLQNAGSSQTWRDIRTQSGTGQVDTSALSSIANANSGAAGTLTWQDQASNAALDVQVSSLSTGDTSSNQFSQVPTLDLRQQLGLNTNQVDTAKINAVGASANLNGGSTGQTGLANDGTMSQLLNAWERMVNAGGSATVNTGRNKAPGNAFGTDQLLSNNLGGKATSTGMGNTVGTDTFSSNNLGGKATSTGMGINRARKPEPRLGVGKLHPSQLRMYDYSDIPFSEPCTQLNLDNGRTHFRLKGKPHKFLQCGANGRMHIMPCSTVGTDWFDVFTGTCVDGPIHVPI